MLKPVHPSGWKEGKCWGGVGGKSPRGSGGGCSVVVRACDVIGVTLFEFALR